LIRAFYHQSTKARRKGRAGRAESAGRAGKAGRVPIKRIGIQ